jgi:hypothetical protein
MHRTIFLPLFLALMGIAPLANASKEGVLTFDSFKIESSGIGDSGPVVLSGRQSPDGFENMEVNAFGKTFVFTEAKLKLLRGSPVNGMQLSYEHGYAELGGRTLYLLFSKGFTSGITEARLVTITEDGAIAIDPDRKQNQSRN